MQIREYAQADFERFQEMNFSLQELERQWEPDCRAYWKDLGESYAMAVAQDHADGKSMIFVVEAADEVLGFLTCRIDASTNPISGEGLRRYLYIQDIYIEPAMRRQGIGQALLHTAECHGKAHGVRYAIIGVLQKNRVAHQAYLKAGFEPFELKLRKMLAP
jgi:GNAT superfamily N-acetyltransferase